MSGQKFDVRKFEKLNNPGRLKKIPIVEIVKEMELKDVETIVDLGAGTGLFAKEVAKLYPNAKILGLDNAQIMIDYLNENIVDKMPKLQPILVDGVTIPLKTETVDLLFTVTVHHELDEPLKVIKEANRVLRQNGTLLIIDWKDSYRPNHGMYKIETIVSQLEIGGFNVVKTDESFDAINVIVAKKV